MKSTGIIALVAAGVIAGGVAATYELTRPSSDPLQVNYVEPAATTTTSAPTAEPTTATTKAPAPATSTTTSKAAVAVTSKSTTHKATVRKEATVSQPQETTAQPSTTTTTPAPAGTNAPRKGPDDAAPGTPAATGVFGGPSKG